MIQYYKYIVRVLRWIYKSEDGAYLGTRQHDDDIATVNRYTSLLLSDVKSVPGDSDLESRRGDRLHRCKKHRVSEHKEHFNDTLAVSTNCTVSSW